MNSSTWSLLLSLAGLALGFISAYTQIRTFFAKLFRFSADAAKRWAKRRSDRIEVFANHPSALVAHVTGVALSVLFVLIASGALLYLLHHVSAQPSAVLRQAINFSTGIFVGVQIGALSLLISDIKLRIFRGR